MANFTFKPLKKILVPTDFSGNADHALLYATAFASRIQSKLVLFHSSKVPIAAINETVQVSGDEMHEAESNEHLVALKKKIKSQNEGVEVETISKVGFAVEEILNTCESQDIDLIAMGTKGARGLSEIFIGSNTADVIAKASVPVLAIPHNASTAKLDKVIFATNYNDNDFHSIFLLTEFFKPWNPDIVIVHATGSSQTPLETDYFEQFKEDVVTKVRYGKYFFKLLESGNVESAVSDFAYSSGADLISVSKRKRSLFEKIVGVSTTTKLAYHVHIPLLVFPESM
jgi:nucleotide-binding universal stress UspA family protein